MDIFSTEELVGVLRRQRSMVSYWLGMFPRVVQSDREEILFDQVAVGTRSLAPFVSPNVQGKVLATRGFATKVFTPAYVKPKHVVDPTKAIPRMAGEAIAGSLSMQQRFDAAVAQNLSIESAMIQNRWEWMAAQAVIYGNVTVVGENYPSVNVDFGRDASLTSILTGTALWDDPNTVAKPLRDLEELRRRVNIIASTTITRLTFGLSAWAAFTAFPEIQRLLSTIQRGSETVFNTAIGEGTPFEFRGRISGQNGMGSLDLYTYNEKFLDDTGALVDMMDTRDVVGTGPGMQGTQCFGAIMDHRAGLAPMAMFPKMWSQEDPSAVYTMTQSAPLMVPVEPNATFRLRVVSA